jgi:hypothetical protein
MPTDPVPGTYTPPPCEFNRVTINFTVTSEGTQFDRLGLMFLGDVEVFRTSTAEPTRQGIFWTYMKEMYHYGSLWKKEQKLIFDLGNLVNDVYTGTFNTTLTATFFTGPDTPEIADIILPISAQRSSIGQGSAFSVPAQPAIIVHEFPLNIEKAVVSLAACGQGEEEFWYSNVLSSRTETFNSTTGSLNGYSSFREVQLLIDGHLAGVSWPFPVIFTGGIAPGLWRPVVGLDAFDLREHEIDITPFVPLLCDGNPHVFQIQVVGLKEDGVDHAVMGDKVGSSWVVSGKIFLFLNKDGHRTTGLPFISHTVPPSIQISSRVTTNPRGENETLVVNTDVSRALDIRTMIAIPGGYRLSYWRQSLTYSNFNKLSEQGSVQFTSQTTAGFEQSMSGYDTYYTYPLTIHSRYFVDNDYVQIDAALSRSHDFREIAPSVFPPGYRTVDRSTSRFIGGRLSTTQSGHASYSSGANHSDNFSSMQQDFSYKGMEIGNPLVNDEIYHRFVHAVNSTVREDRETFEGQTSGFANRVNAVAVGLPSFAREEVNVRAVLGRGPGRPNKAQWG